MNWIKTTDKNDQNRYDLVTDCCKHLGFDKRSGYWPYLPPEYIQAIDKYCKLFSIDVQLQVRVINKNRKMKGNDNV